MRISVVIATFNRAALLRETLAQLQNQEYAAGDEIVVVDNGSTDGTAAVIAHAAARFPVPVRQLREPSPGKTAALISGLAAAAGDVIALTDDDVLVGDDWIATIRRLFTASPVDLIGGRIDPRWERPAPRWLRVLNADHTYDPMCAPLALLHYGDAQALGSRTAIGANMAVRRNVLDALGGMAPHLGRQRGTLLCGEDHDLCQRAVAAGFRCEYRPELRVRHWVPVARTRLRYFVRWSFWCGITHARLEQGQLVHFARRLLTAPIAAALCALTGRLPDAASHLMDAAFAAGYVAERLNTRRKRGGLRGEPQEGRAARQHAGVHG